MTKEELNEIFKWLETTINKDNLFYFKLDVSNQISCYFKSNNKRLAQFYMDRIKKHIDKNRIEILADYFNEWEDINVGMVYSGNTEDEIMRNRYFITQLIKNQKYLKERLNKDE